MKKKLGVIITLLTLCICLMTPQMHAKAASGKTTIAVSAGSLNIGQTVTVTAKALSASGDSAYANMVLTYDAGILEFVSCNATYGGGGGSISVASDSFSVTLKAISAGKASISLSATDGVIYGTEEELDSMAGSSTSVTVKNEAAGSNTGNNSSAGNNGSSGSNGNAGNGSSSGTGSNNNTGSNTNTAALSADNSLKALTISPGTLSPAFKGSTTKYTATVDNSVTSIAVSARPVFASLERGVSACRYCVGRYRLASIAREWRLCLAIYLANRFLRLNSACTVRSMRSVSSRPRCCSLASAARVPRRRAQFSSAAGADSRGSERTSASRLRQIWRESMTMILPARRASA